MDTVAISTNSLTLAILLIVIPVPGYGVGRAIFLGLMIMMIDHNRSVRSGKIIIGSGRDRAKNIVATRVESGKMIPGSKVIGV